MPTDDEKQQKHWVALAVANKLGNPEKDCSCAIEPPAELEIDFILDNQPIRKSMNELISLLKTNKRYGGGELRPSQQALLTHLEQVRDELALAGINPTDHGAEVHLDPSSSVVTTFVTGTGMAKLAKQIVANQARVAGGSRVSLILEDGTNANAARIQRAIFAGAASANPRVGGFAPGQAPDSVDDQTLFVSQRTLDNLRPRAHGNGYSSGR